MDVKVRYDILEENVNVHHDSRGKSVMYLRDIRLINRIDLKLSYPKPRTAAQ